MRNLSGQFEITKWEEESFAKVSKPRKAHQADITYKTSGDMAGTLTGKYVMLYIDEKNAHYSGALWFEGTIGDKSGGFFIEEKGQFGNYVAQTKWRIVEKSGVGDFTAIQGEGGYAATGQRVDFNLNVNGL